MGRGFYGTGRLPKKGLVGARVLTRAGGKQQRGRVQCSSAAVQVRCRARSGVGGRVEERREAGGSQPLLDIGGSGRR